MTTALDDDVLYREIGRDFRRRMPGVYLCLAVSALLLLPLPHTMSMMHGDGDYTAVMGRIVEVSKDPQTGRLLMTSEYTDASGTVHRDTEHDGYHYAAGDPQVGQPIEYLYKTLDVTGEVRGFPRADRMLKWVFGGPAAFLALVGAVFAWLLLRKRAWRRRLVREGRREPGQAPTIRHKTMVVPTRHATHVIPLWRVEASWFDPDRAQFIACHGEWEKDAPPADDATLAPVILVDPRKPSRYWLPTSPVSSG
jgi:hypothetical protein